MGQLIDCAILATGSIEHESYTQLLGSEGLGQFELFRRLRVSISGQSAKLLPAMKLCTPFHRNVDYLPTLSITRQKGIIFWCFENNSSIEQLRKQAQHVVCNAAT
jgi:hypothetical protein